MIRIPTETGFSSNTTRTVTFEGRLLTLTFLWNEFSGSFFLNISDGLGGSTQGIRIVEDMLLLVDVKAFIDFSGDILVIREDSETGPELTYTNFGDGWNLYLLTAEEASQWSTDNGL